MPPSESEPPPASSLQLHATLRWRTNVALVLAWGSAGVALLFVMGLKLWPFPLFGAVTGAAGGAIQWAAVRKTPQEFRAARNAWEVRAALQQSTWGRRYLWFFWMNALARLALAAWVSAEHSPAVLKEASWPLGAAAIGLVAYADMYFAFAFLREAVTLYPSVTLGREQRDAARSYLDR